MRLRPPEYRLLRGYAFDPLISRGLDTIDINEVVYFVRWEDLAPGPVGEYVEVVDYDPTTETFYAPVDLNEPYVLATCGLSPSESNPQFHQQMVYAVAMLTINSFEQALGRKVIWAPRLLVGTNGQYQEYVDKLRIYPHAMREANAYYSPLKNSVLLGYFSASPRLPSAETPGSLVFTCLSHDIVAHEVTHAILDGLGFSPIRPTNPDVLAVHEAFSDLVALLQHFTFSDTLKHQISRTRGELGKQNLLGELAQQLGVSIGRYGSLRSAIGEYDESGEWRASAPDPNSYKKNLEPHARGSILVAAVFEAFLEVYKRRIEDLRRIASGGRGVLPEGQLDYDLVSRLAAEASKTARNVLTMCIRAIDYCPPVDLTFGDFLRAVITADCELVRDDPHHYRRAFIEAFRRRGIFPEGIRNLTEENLVYDSPDTWADEEAETLFGIIGGFLKGYRAEVMHETDRRRIYEITRDHLAGRPAADGVDGIVGLHRRLFEKFDNSCDFEKITGLVFNRGWKDYGIQTSSYRDLGSDYLSEGPSFQIVNLRLVSRMGPNGTKVNRIVLGLVQRMGVVLMEGKLKRHYVPGRERPKGGFEVYGGCTMIFDLQTLQLKHAVSKPLYSRKGLDRRKREVDVERIRRQYRYVHEGLPMVQSKFGQHFHVAWENNFGEPFAFLHRR